MKDYFLTPTDYETIIHFTSDIITIKENLRSSIQHKLDEYFGYSHTIFWQADEQGNLSNPINYLLNDAALHNYLDEYYTHDLLHPTKNLHLFKQNKALRLIDVLPHHLVEESIFYTEFLKRFHLHDEMVIALFHQHSFVGVLGMARENTRNKFSLKDQKILNLLSDIIASTLLHENKNDFNQLTERELEIAKLVKSGWSNQKIANQLYISVNTVKKHLQSIYRKCDVQNKIQLVQKF